MKQKELNHREVNNTQNTILEKNKLASNHKPHWKQDLNQGKINQKWLRVQNELKKIDYEENKSEENNIDDELNEFVKN